MKLGALLLWLLCFASAEACTTFCISKSGEIVFGRNYDWYIGNGMLMVNKRNVSKTAMPQNGERSAAWASQYGSVTFNEYGREFPTGGINETGLVVELMMLNSSQYPAKDHRPVVGCLEWIQYQLDKSRTIADVLKNARTIRISATTKLHYLVCDRTGSCVTVEFVDGKFAPHYGTGLPVAVLTNDTYRSSLDYLSTLKAFGGSSDPGTGSASLERFGRAAIATKEYQRGATNAVQYSFDVLDNVSQSSFTKWNIVYDLANLRVYFRTSVSRQIKQVNVSSLNFSCGTPVSVMNINSSLQGDVTRSLRNYSTQINRNLVRESYHRTSFLSNIPDAQLEPIITHPDSFRCLQ